MEPTTSKQPLDMNSTGYQNMTSSTITTTGGPPENALAGLDDLPQYIVAFYINKFYLYVITAVGLPGNIAAIVTLCTMTPMTSSSVYMTMLAVVDTGSILVKVVYLDLTKFDVQISHGGCSTVFLLGTYLMHYANWILVAMTIERFLAIWRPLQVAELCTRRRAVMVLVVMGIVLLGLNLHFIWTTYEGWDDFYKWNCQFKSEFSFFMEKVWYWIDGAVYSLVPFLILLVFNILIIVGLRRQHKRMAMKVDKTKLTEKMKQQQQLTFMLISVSVVFVLLTMPNCAMFIIQNYWDYMVNARVFARYYLTYQLVFVLSDANHAVNFYLYCLTGRKFRQHFLRLLCCRQTKAHMRTATYLSHITSSTRRHVTVSMDQNGEKSSSQNNLVGVIRSEGEVCGTENPGHSDTNGVTTSHM